MKEKIIKFANRFHLLWVLFYMVLLGSTATYAKHLYVQYDNDQLPNGEIELLINKEAYQLGEEIVFTVVNHFPTTVYVTNHCPDEPLHVFKWVNEGWTQIHDVATEGNSECYTQERNVAIAPDSSRSYNFNDWQNLFSDPGVYRIAMEIDHYTDIPFQDFVILEPQEVVQIKKDPTYVYVPAKIEVTPEVIETETPEPQTVIIEEVYYEEEDNSEEDNQYYADEYENEEEHASTLDTAPYRDALLKEYPGANITKLSLEDDGRAEFKFIYNGREYEGKMNASYVIVDIE